jgi:hypothetical protein
MPSILDDLVATRASRARLHTNADQLAQWTDPTPDGLEASPGYIPGFRAARNRRLPRPEFREINRAIPEAVYRAGVPVERATLRAILQGAGVESRTVKPDPTIKVQKPWSQELAHNRELSLDATEAERQRRREEHENWVITQKAEIARLSALKFERMANAYHKALNPAD